jgi:hypothetical protein
MTQVADCTFGQADPKTDYAISASVVKYDELTHNWSCTRFFEASRTLGGETAGRGLGILEFLQRMDSAPPQGEDVKPAVDIGRAADQGGFALPPGEDACIPRPTFDRHIGKRDVKIRQDVTETLEPESDGVLVVTLAAERVVARNAMMDVRHKSFDRFIPTMIVHVIEGLADFHPHDGTVDHLSSPLKNQ